MREIVFDTETTGLNVDQGHRLIEIGCVELDDLIPTGRTFHHYLNPDRLIEQGAVDVHGITNAMLEDKPRFWEIAEALVAFVGDAPLVAHNAGFDRGFLNKELSDCGWPDFPADRFVDTMLLCRQRWPSQQANLDAVCERLGIDTSRRVKHGALLDAEILAEVYVELRGGRQPGLALSLADARPIAARPRVVRAPRPHAPSAEELAAHTAFVDALPDPMWRRG